MSDARKILQITSYPPPRAGWAVRVEHLKRQLEADGHQCVVLNIGMSRKIPSGEYETVLGGFDYVHKVWRYSRRGYVAHIHVNGKSPKGFVLTILAQIVNLVVGQRSVLTFHAGADQTYFPRPKYPFLWPVFWLMFTLPRSIICNDETVKAKIVEYGVDARKISPIQAFSQQYLDVRSAELPTALASFYTRFREVVFCYINALPIYHPGTALEGFAMVAASRPDTGLVLCGLDGHRDLGLLAAIEERIEKPDLKERVVVVGDLSHDAFIEGLRRASVYLRTPPSDGVSSSVLEALSLRVPVVASENGARPLGATTYPASDPVLLAQTLGDVLDRHDEIAATLPEPEVPDTLAEEVSLLTV